ncbi:MAG: S8 family serine peptidase, partial [Anaerolineales bacterium]
MRQQKSILLSIVLSFIAIVGLLSTVKNSSASVTPPPNPSSPQGQFLTKVHPALLRHLTEGNAQELIPIIVEWKRSPEIYQESFTPNIQSKANQRKSLIATLQNDAEVQTADLVQYMQQAQKHGQVKNIQRFWISPIIALSANTQVIQNLAKRQDVVGIRPDEKIILNQDNLNNSQTEPLEENTWLYNLDLIEVDKVQQLFGFNGKNIVVANIDTGVDYYHPALTKKYRGYNPNGILNHNGNWFVVTGEPYIYPGDGYGHGTHTMGTILGDDEAGHRVGVAPGAQWIAVKAFTNQGYTYESWLHAAFQWIIAPDGNPSLAPDIVNNSWGSENGGDARFRDDIKALRAAGILPIFSAGNTGPSIGSINSPASYPESIAVGAVDSAKLPTTFSSRGPSYWNEIKPDLSAPGVNILSSYPGGGYVKMDGTSMAAPHVAGVAALLLEANPALTVDQLEQILISSAEPLGQSVPNNDTGYGLVNALTAVLQVTQNGVISGKVLSAATNLPIPFPTITITSHDPNFTPISISGNQNGEYQVALLTGVYDLQFSAFGYESQNVYSQNVNPNQTSTLNISLTPASTGTLRG